MSVSQENTNKAVPYANFIAQAKERFNLIEKIIVPHRHPITGIIELDIELAALQIRFIVEGCLRSIVPLHEGELSTMDDLYRVWKLKGIKKMLDSLNIEYFPVSSNFYEHEIKNKTKENSTCEAIEKFLTIYGDMSKLLHYGDPRGRKNYLEYLDKIPGHYSYLKEYLRTHTIEFPSIDGFLAVSLETARVTPFTPFSGNLNS